MEIPGYIIQREIGKGGMATVYLAIQESLNRLEKPCAKGDSPRNAAVVWRLSAGVTRAGQSQILPDDFGRMVAVHRIEMQAGRTTLQ